MGIKYVFNPTTGNLDATSVELPAGSTTQVQFNDGGAFGGDADLTWNKTTNVLGIAGDVNLSDGGSFTTTLQTITPTLSNKTISLPNATGTVALVAGSSGQITYNNAGANAGVSSFTADSSGRLTNSASSASGFPVKLWNGTIFAGTTPHVLVQPSTASAGSWSASGTALGVNTAAGFTGRLIDCQVNGSALFNVDNSAASETRIFTSLVSVAGNIRQTGGGFSINGNSVGVRDTGTFDFWSGVAASPSVIDLRLFRDAANTLAQRNGTAAQTYRVYNTFTSSTNYELGKLEWNTNVFRIGTEKGSGGGTARDLAFQTDGTERMRITSGGNVAIGTTSATELLNVNGHSFTGSAEYYTTARTRTTGVTWYTRRGTARPTAGQKGRATITFSASSGGPNAFHKISVTQAGNLTAAFYEFLVAEAAGVFSIVNDNAAYNKAQFVVSMSSPVLTIDTATVGADWGSMTVEVETFEMGNSDFTLAMSAV